MTREGIIKVCSEGTKQRKIENVFYFSLTSISFFSSRRTGKGCASVLNIQCSSGRRSSSENIKYKYLEREREKKKERWWGSSNQPCHKATYVSVILWRPTDSRRFSRTQSSTWRHSCSGCQCVRTTQKPSRASAPAMTRDSCTPRLWCQGTSTGMEIIGHNRCMINVLMVKTSVEISFGTSAQSEENCTYFRVSARKKLCWTSS